MDTNTLWIGNDHGGYDLKRQIMEHIKKNHGIAAHNVGADTTEIVRYPHYAAHVAEAVSEGKASRGILICSTGIGMSIIANKFKGVRASVCTSSYTAKMTRAHNDSNILCLGGKTIGLFEALDMVDIWLTTDYEGGRHDISLGLVSEAEDALSSGCAWVPEIDDAATPGS
jgi:ribose 5-phosphate isomerase B